MDELMLRVLLVDDEPLALRRLTLALRAMPDVDIVGSAGDGDAALDEARRLKPDLIILDVEMPGRDGLSVAAELERDDGPGIIILSAFDRYAAAAFDVEALDYLLKPLRPDRLRQAIDRARRRRAEKAARVAVLADEIGLTLMPTIHIPDRHGGRDLSLSEVVWIEAARDYALLHTSMRTHMLRATMSDLARQLPDSILRVHRSAFVSLAHVRRWGTPMKGIHSLVLSDGSEVSIGPSYIQDVRAALRSLDW
jgi:DNA-binding LytR/AlgR family response regulator